MSLQVQYWQQAYSINTFLTFFGKKFITNINNNVIALFCVQLFN